MPNLSKPFDEPIAAAPVDGEVVLLGPGVCGSYAPEAILKSLDSLRLAAETALKQREQEARGTTP